MNKYLCIKKLYPNIADSEFTLQDDSNGIGAYIREWKSSYPQPTQAQLKAVYPQVLKEQMLENLKVVCNQVLYKNHNIEDKIEALAGLKTTQEILEIKNWIKAVKYVFGQVKTQINNAVTVANIEAISVNYDAILGQIETYYLTL